jgi:hypothetical protein|tara:strand:+ start:6992 stop:7429 length:438 start_codon:yes stop_codon:yes gene_type:complete
MKSDKKILDIREDLNNLLREWEDFRKNKKSCTKGIHNCDFLQLFLDYAQSIDEFINPVEEYASSCLTTEGDAVYVDKKDVLKTLVLMQKNAMNMLTKKLKEILDEAQITAEQNNEEYSAFSNRLEQINRNLNRVSLFVELENDLA